MPGETGRTTFRGLVNDQWVAEAKVRADKLRPTAWRASVLFHDPKVGKVRRLTANRRTKREAEEALDDAVSSARHTEGQKEGAGAMTLGRAVRARLRSLEAGETDLAPKSVTTYGNVIRRHLLSDESIIREIPLADLTALQIEADMRRVSAAGAHTQLRHYRANLNAVFTTAVQARVLAENPMDRVGTVKAPRTQKDKVYGNGVGRRKNRALTDPELETLEKKLADEPDHVQDLVHLLLDMGLRISEAISLREEDVDLDADTLTVNGKLVRVRGGGLVWDPVGKNDLSYRTLPLRKRARRSLVSRHEAKRAPEVSEHLFATPRGGMPDVDNYNSILRKLFDRAGLQDVTAHALRRTVERDLERAGLTVSQREVFMGHTEKVARKHYADHSALSGDVAALLDENVQ